MCSLLTCCTLLFRVYLLITLDMNYLAHVQPLNSLYAALPVVSGFTFLSLLVRITLKWMLSQVLLRLVLLDDRLTIGYVKNRTYIFKASKRQLIQVNYLLNLRYEFK